MNLIVDASVAVKWFMREPLQEEALTLLESRAGDLEAPDLLVVETANIAWKKSMRGEITPWQARTIPAEVLDYVAKFRDSAEIIHRALEMALFLRHPVYDCLYLACAEAADGIVVTADERFVRAVEGTEFATRVALLGTEIPN